MPTDLFADAGPLRPVYDEVDWAATPLGPVEGWSEDLRSAVGVMLATRFSATLIWGDEHVLIYNTEYADLIGTKHPAALGARTQDVFPEAWDYVGSLLTQVRADGGGTWAVDQLIPLERHGFLEDCFFTFSYSVVRDSAGEVAGVLDMTVETTAQVLALRRQEVLLRLSDALAGTRSVDDIVEVTRGVLATAQDDLPWAEVRLEPGVAADGGEVVLPLRADLEGGGGGPVLAVRLSDRLHDDRSYRTFVRLLADAVAQALDRVARGEAERALHASEREFSVALQRSLLSMPAEPDDVRVAVRYEPAGQVAQVGGDWHDSFVMPDGVLGVTIGDVSGHDRDAAAAMAQTRNLLRGIAFTLEESPAKVLSALDRAIASLTVDTFASAILARVEEADGRRALRWSNAGHPPPVLLTTDGTARLLEAEPDLLLGLDPSADRSDHVVDLAPGDTLLMYTDGLVERRTTALDEGLAWLVGVMRDRQDLGVDELADLLLAECPPGAEDDVALLVLRAV